MLWKKESFCNDAPLLDIIDSYDGCNFFRFLDDGSDKNKDIKKSNKLSNHYRNKAMEQASAKNWHEAIELINQALCFAENESKELGGTYADRASCYFNLKSFNECLIDISLAKVNNCPTVFLPKLNKWKDSCIKMVKNPMERRDAVHVETNLDFDANEQYPCAANVLQIERNPNCERNVIAQSDIGIGQIILIEEGFVWSTTEKYRRCCVCLKTTTNLVPCKNCTDSLLCYGKCEKNELHSIECQMDLNIDDENEPNLYLVVRSILTAMNIIPNISELMRFVQRVIDGDENGNRTVSDSVSTSLSKYLVFLENGLKWQWPKKQSKFQNNYATNIFFFFVKIYSHFFQFPLKIIHLKYLP